MSNVCHFNSMKTVTFKCGTCQISDTHQARSTVVRALDVLPSDSSGLLPQSYSNVVSFSQSQSWLRKYGYLSEASQQMSTMQSAQILLNAVSEMQRFYGLEVTGVMDQTTLKYGCPSFCHPVHNYKSMSCRHSNRVLIHLRAVKVNDQLICIKHKAFNQFDTLSLFLYK